ncbi:MAG TPA: serine/threonine-protein kinase [Terriglobia bacterium]|nr:serine/threonine-protein kinase [Terriglobia bacterium]
MNKIGRYVIISELGRGAMGVVYKASDPTIGREVALKVLSLTPAAGEGTSGPQEMFMREARAAGRLAHPSIVTVHDAFEDKDQHTQCIVMELVPGVTLEKILESGHPLTVEQIFSVVRQVAEGLDYAHRNNVIHRDLKPANILVTADGRAKITDFGIAKVLAREGMGRTIGMMGTPSYMSPEQVKGGDVDGRTDIFSLGIILFTLLSGKKPFAGNTAAVMFKIVYEEPAAPSSLNPGLTAAYDYVVKRCLAKDRTQRYASARELLNDLDDLQRGRPLRSQGAAPGIPLAPAVTPAAPPLEQTRAMPVPGLMRSLSQPTGARPAAPPAPPAPARPAAARPPVPAAPPPAVPAKTVSPVASTTFPQTLDLPIRDLMKGTMEPSPGVASAAPAPPPTAAQSPRSAVPPATAPEARARPLSDRTLPLPIPDLSAVSLNPPASPRRAPLPVSLDAPVLDSTLPMPVPHLPAGPPPPPSTPPPARPPLLSNGPAVAEQTRPLPAPGPAAGSPLSFPAAAPPPPTGPPVPLPFLSPEPTRVEQTLPLPAPDPSGGKPVLSGRTVPMAPVLPDSPPDGLMRHREHPDYYEVTQPAKPQPAMPLLAPPPAEAGWEEPAEVPGTVTPFLKSKLFPVAVGAAAIVLIAVALGIYWKVRQARNAAAPTPPVTAQTQPAAPPPAPAAAPVETSAAASAATSPSPLVSAPPSAATKTAKRKQKQAVAPAPEPAPPAAQPEPAVVTPAPAPEPPKPSPEDIAKAEAARLAKIPQVIKVNCNLGFKEATIVFSSGGQSLLQQSLKGEKKKGGFLGIKGSHQIAFQSTVTVPGEASELSIRVVTKDAGGRDMVKDVKMPPRGGLVPTLVVAADSDHISADWRTASSPQ